MRSGARRGSAPGTLVSGTPLRHSVWQTSPGSHDNLIDTKITQRLALLAPSLSPAASARRRSEERRVGKECRSRGSPRQSKKRLTKEEPATYVRRLSNS